MESKHPRTADNNVSVSASQVMIRNNELMAVTTKETAPLPTETSEGSTTKIPEKISIIVQDVRDYAQSPAPQDDIESESEDEEENSGLEEEDDTPSKATEEKTDDEATRGATPKVTNLLASNNVRDNDRWDEPIPEAAFPPLEITLLPSAPSQDLSGSPALFLLKRTKPEYKKFVFPETDVGFQEHIGNVLSLIKSTYGQSNEQERLKAFKTLRSYVVLHSCPKISGRIKRGTKERNLFQFASLTGKNLGQGNSHGP